MTSSAEPDRPVARVYGVVLDCPDVEELAGFWQRLLGYEIAVRELDWISLVDPADRSRRLSVQQVGTHRPPTWPGGETPQQVHLDLAVDDLSGADERARQLGAVPLSEVQSDQWETLRVYRDPAGHPFCLIEQHPAAGR